MRRTERSRTAEWVAIARTAGAYLPPKERLASDPYGVSFAGAPLRRVFRVASAQPQLFERVLAVPSSLRNFVLWMQLRTRAIDDALLGFAAAGSAAQIVILGAGHDMRAVRFRAALAGASVFEVDHPRTQEQKRAVLASKGIGSDSRYVAFDFEHEPISLLAERLAESGFDATRRTLTLWEGVTMYLREPSIDASLRAIRAYSGHGSALVLTYLDARVLRAPGGEQRLTQRLTACVGEPYVFGWAPGALAPFAAERGFGVRWDETDLDLAERYLPQLEPSAFEREERHVAELRVV
jgi:methyltransferase (TIGR00027 family)